MLEISDDQMDILQRDLDRRYADELVTNIRENTPNIVFGSSDDVLSSRITTALPLLRYHGIRGEAATAQLATLAAALSPSFLEDENVRRFLDAPGLPIDAKVEMLCELLLEPLSK